jgi:hypothetical protein
VCVGGRHQFLASVLDGYPFFKTSQKNDFFKNSNPFHATEGISCTETHIVAIDVVATRCFCPERLWCLIISMKLNVPAFYALNQVFVVFMPENVKLSRKNTELKLTHSREQSPS